MKIGNKKELKSIAEENWGHIDFKDILKNIIIVLKNHIHLC